MIKNSKGAVFYGLHFYPGVAEYKEPNGSFRVFVNEDTIRAMGPTFAGRPVFVQHVDDVPNDKDELRREADGWVIESFFNEADGKHWVKFIVVSDKGEKAIASGYRLSNCYTPKSFSNGGEWNGVSYQKEVTGGEYDHLAIVADPRYEESIILTPEQFKDYNESKRLELKKLANDNLGGKRMKFFRKAKVENSADLESTVVVLPKSGRELSILQLVNELDIAKDEKVYANGAHMVKVGENEMSVDELVNAYMESCKNAAAEEMENADDDGGVDDEIENEDDEDLENEVTPADDEKVKKEALAIAEHEEKEIEEAKKKNAKEKADRLKNAQHRAQLEDESPVFDPYGGVKRGVQRYGSN